MSTVSRSLLAAALLSPMAFAQFDPAVGTNLNLADDQILDTTISFPFTFPDGSAVTTVRVDSNGRVVIDPAEGSDFSPSVTELLTRGSSICPLWDDLSPNRVSGAEGVFFNDLGTYALYTWVGVPTFSGGFVVDCQLQLNDDNSFVIRYGSSVPVGNGFLLGSSAGNGAADPGASDISAGVMTAGVPDVYEGFPGGAFDLAGANVTFTPDGSGGYDIVTTFPPVGTATFGQPGCVGPNITFTPDGSGGYDVAAGGTFDEDYLTLGTPLGLGDDDTSDQNAGFPFTMPGGSVAFEVRIDSNGRISDTLNAESSDFNLTVGEFLSETASIACASDFSPNQGGEVYFMQTSYGCSATWDGVPQFLTGNSNTFQIQLNFDGSIVFAFRALDIQASNDFLVGVSAGGGAADPGESDLSAGVMSGGVSEVYEFFDLAGSDVVDFNAPATPVLSALTSPSIGTNFETQISNAPDSVSDFILIGPASTIDLGTLFPGSGYEGCFTYVDLATEIVGNPMPGGVFSLPIPNDSALIGAQLVAQGLVVDPINRPQVLNLNFSNSLDLELGL